MGVASSVATNLYEKKTTGKEEVEEEKLDAEIKSLVESTQRRGSRLRNYCLHMGAKRRSYLPIYGDWRKRQNARRIDFLDIVFSTT